jgi:flagellar hook assembly protein FlgD
VHLYDVAGRRVRTLVHGELPAGFHHAAWDGRDDRGQNVGNGVYFYRIVAGDWRSLRKLILLQN